MQGMCIQSQNSNNNYMMNAGMVGNMCPTFPTDFNSIALTPPLPMAQPQMVFPQMNGSVSVSPAVSPQFVPLVLSTTDLTPMSLTGPSISPLPTMALPMNMNMMGYSMLPVQGGQMMMPFPQPQTRSLSPEMNLYSYSQDNVLAYSPPVSISRSASPQVAEEHPFVRNEDYVKEISRDRLPSEDSSQSSHSVERSLTPVVPLSKKELVENCLKEVDRVFGSRVQTAGMRGPTVMRIKVKTRPALEKICGLLKTLEEQCQITAISCPKSTKKGKQHVRGFLAYLQAATPEETLHVQKVFDAYNLAHTTDAVAPFKSLEINPQKKSNC